MHGREAARLLREARQRAGLSQRELAARAGTSQSVIGRIEAGLSSPSWETLAHLVAAAGFELRGSLEIATIADSHMLDDVERILALTPEERLLELANIARLTSGARRA